MLIWTMLKWLTLRPSKSNKWAPATPRHVRMAHAVEICWVNNNFPANISCSNSFSKGFIWTDYVRMLALCTLHSCLELGGTACLSVLPLINYQSSFWMVGSGPCGFQNISEFWDPAILHQPSSRCVRVCPSRMNPMVMVTGEQSKLRSHTTWILNQE